MEFLYLKKSLLIVDTQFRDSEHKPLGPILTSYSKVFYTFVVIFSSTIRPLKTLQIHGYIRRPLAVRMLGWSSIWSNFEFMISYHARGSFLQLYRTLKRAFNCIMSSGCPSDLFRSQKVISAPWRPNPQKISIWRPQTGFLGYVNHWSLSEPNVYFLELSAGQDVIVLMHNSFCNFPKPTNNTNQTKTIWLEQYNYQ